MNRLWQLKILRPVYESINYNNFHRTTTFQSQTQWYTIISIWKEIGQPRDAQNEQRNDRIRLEKRIIKETLQTDISQSEETDYSDFDLKEEKPGHLLISYESHQVRIQSQIKLKLKPFQIDEKTMRI